MLAAGILNGAVMNAGYRIVSISEKQFYVHRLVAEAFHGSPQADMAYKTVNHKNGDKLDNTPDNLEWATYGENARHARATGLCKQHGQNTNLSKHSDQFIQAVRNVHAAYRPSYKELGRLFGLRDGHVGQIIKMETRVKLSPIF